MEMAFTRRERIVGVFITGIVILLLAAVVMIGRGKDWFVTYVSYYTTFKESYNLAVNTPVKLFNADIGKVKKITLVRNLVEVELAIAETYTTRIRKDTVASVKSPTLIGSEFVDIKPGDPFALLIPEGGKIPSVEKKSIARVLEEFQIEKTAKMFVEAIQNLALIVQTIQEPKGPLFSLFDHANNSLGSLDLIVQDIRSGKGTLGDILVSRALIDNIQDKIDRVGSILEDVNQVTAKMPQTMAVVQDTLKASQPLMQGLGKATAKLPRTLDEVQDTLKASQPLMKGLGIAAAKVPRTLDEVQRTLKVSQKVMKDITKTTAKLPQTIDRVQDTIETFKATGDELITRLKGLKKIVNGAEETITSLNTILKNVERGSPEIPQILKVAKAMLLDVRDTIGNLDKLIQALQNNILFRSNLPPEPKLDNIDAGLRE